VGDLPIVHASSKLWLKLEIIILNWNIVTVCRRGEITHGGRTFPLFLIEYYRFYLIILWIKDN
jgi:hypothetical protein